MSTPTRPGKSWSIHTRPEITSKYSIQSLIGAGAYSSVYKAVRLSDSATVALKEVHDYQSAFREIEALTLLQNSPNVVVLYEYFWSEDEDDAVLVLEYLRSDLGKVIREGRKDGVGLGVAEVKRWMLQVLSGVDACHRSGVVHRDLKPSNLLVGEGGVLKVADFGQARILLGPGLVSIDENPQPYEQEPIQIQRPEGISETEINRQEAQMNLEQEALCQEIYGGYREPVDEDIIDNIDANTSCLATCTNSDAEEDLLKSDYSYEVDENRNDNSGSLTSCVGTRWYRAPELLYGSTNYGLEIDLWSLGCIFAELFNLEPLFPGTSDIDQLSRIFSVLGNLTEEVWPRCTSLPDYRTISFCKIENPSGLEKCLPNRSPDEIRLVEKLLHFDPACRATAMELLHDNYLNQEPLPVPVSQLRVPTSHSAQEEGSSGEWGNYEEMGSDSDFDDLGPLNVTKSGTGFSIRFS